MKDYIIAYSIGLLLGFLTIVVIYFFYLIMKVLKSKEKEEKEENFYCEVEQWGKCREQCKICKKN
jgi:hypothetical protein